MPSRRDVLAGTGCAAVAALAGCLGDSDAQASPGTKTDADWPMPRFDAENSAYNPNAKAPRDGVRERWTVDEGWGVGTPTVVDGTVFLPTAEALVALDATSGDELWRFSPSEQPWPSSPTVHDGLVYVSFRDGDGLYALDANSGAERWSLPDARHVRARPHLVAGDGVHESVLFAGTERGKLLRIDPKTGEVTWQTDLFGSISAFAFRLPTLYVGTRGGEVYSLPSAHIPDEPPTEGWRTKVGSAVEAMVPSSEGLVVHTFGGPLQCLQSGAHAGTTRWTIDGKWANTAPVHANYTFYAAGYDGLSANRDHDKHTKWRFEGRYDASAPVAAGDTLYVSGGDAVHAFAMDGGVGVGTYRTDLKRWSHSLSDNATQGLAVADGALFVACSAQRANDTALYCLEPA